jgi:alpha-D-xyloside xylohydrolase
MPLPSPTRIVPFALLLPLLLPHPTRAQAPAYTQSATGVLIPAHDGTIELRPLAEGVIRVLVHPPGMTPSPAEEVVFLPGLVPPAFRVQATPEAVIVDAGSLTAQVDRRSGALTFLDARGAVLLREEVAGRRLASAAPGQPPATLQEAFVSPKDEYLFGGGQFQDGFLNVRDLPRRLTQVNTQIALPFFLSSRGYGLLWHNYGRTDLNPADHPVRLTRTGTGTYSIDQSLSGNAAVPDERPTAYFSGEFEVSAAGPQAMMLDSGWKMERRYHVEIDGRTVVDFANYWLPPTTSWFTTLSAGRHQVRVAGDIDDQPTLYIRPAGDRTTLRSFTGRAIDYAVLAGPSGDEVIRRYRAVTGAAPLMPKWAYGFIQSRARYYSQAELLANLRTFREKRLPLDGIVQDWMYWGKYGWNAMRFDETDYPDPAAMVQAVHAQHAHLMISVWSRIAPETEIGQAFKAGHLYVPGTDWVDFFNPAARALYWKDFSTRMLPFGIDAWWLDATEPENDDLHDRAVFTGSGDDVRLLYPLMVNRTVYEGLRRDAPDRRVFILTRNAFLGQQRYASATWSGDVGNGWDTLKREITAGLGFSASGLPYWTTDTGGFFRPGASQFADAGYHERLLRWFEFSTFTPLLRVHGWLTPTELWLYGPQVEAVTRHYLDLRYRLLPYIYSAAGRITREGSTLLRPLVMDFPRDQTALQQKYEFMFGPALLVAPVVAPGAVRTSVYLPAVAGGWYDFWTERAVAGGRSVEAASPLDRIPVFVPAGSMLPLGPAVQYAAEQGADPIELRVYPGADGTFTLYEDEGTNYAYEQGQASTITFTWHDAKSELEIGPRTGGFPTMLSHRRFVVHLAGAAGAARVIAYDGEPLRIRFP